LPLGPAFPIAQRNTAGDLLFIGEMNLIATSKYR
jgi:hypothetical protein